MSMTMHLLRLPQEQLEKYLQQPALLEEQFYSDDRDETPEWLYLDKAWDGLLYILTGRGLAERVTPEELEESPMLLRAALYNQKMVDEQQDFGYGPARYVPAEEVKALFQRFQGLEEDDLEDQYDVEKMTNLSVYPTGIWEDDPRGNWEYLMVYLEKLVEFYGLAAARGEGVISFIS